jgi:RNA polymerase sigma-B factor
METETTTVEEQFGRSIDEIAAHYAQCHDDASKLAIVKRGHEFVHFIARKFLYRGESYEDLVQIGMLGMVHALDNYRPQEGVRFLSYAMHAVVGEIRHHFRDHSSLIKIPRRLRDRYNELQFSIRQFAERNSRSPTLKELSKDTGFTEDQVLEALESSESLQSYSLDSPIEGMGDLDQGMDPIPFLDAINVTEVDIGDPILDRESIAVAMEVLDRKEKKIIYLMYYLNLSQADVAERMALSQAHISRIMILALQKLNRALKR